MFERNIELKLMERSFTDDIGPLLAPQFKKTHTIPLITENNRTLITENGIRLTTEGWDLGYAAEEIKNKILICLPR